MTGSKAQPPTAPGQGDVSGLEQIGDGRLRDEASGLVVVPAPAGRLFRVFQAKYSALNPPIPTGDRGSWSRWDVADHVTVYGADTDIAAVVESLAYAAPARLDLADIFPDLTPGDDPVASEWQQLGHLPRGHVARAWRAARQLATVQLRPGAFGYFVDIGHAETIAVLRSTASAWSPDATLLADPARVDTSLLAGGRREITTMIAGWLRGQVLCDGSRPSGIRFTSKHGQNLVCWAAWVPLRDKTGQADVPAMVGDSITVGPTTELLPNAPALLAASRLLGLRVH